MKVLIIGAKGMLGSMLMEVLKEWNPTGWDREDIDITDGEQVRAKIAALRQAQGGIDVIINAAAYTNVDGAETNREAAFAVNEQGVRNLAEAAKEIGATLVHYSTDYVFPTYAKASAGKPGDEFAGYAEDDVPGPAVNVYGESKLAGERVLQEVGGKYYLIRTAWLYGLAYAKATAGKPGGNFVDKMLVLAKEKDRLRVINDQFGSPTFTKDVAEFTKKLLEEKYPSGVYHAVNSGSATWYEFTQEIFRLAKVGIPVDPISTEEYPLPAKRPKYSRLQNTKGPALRAWADALQEYLTVYYTKGL